MVKNYYITKVDSHLYYIIFQMIPITIPQDYFKKLRLIIKYIWAPKWPRIAYATLAKAKRLGELAAPDFKKYYQPICISWMLEWIHNKEGRSWVNMEISQSKVDLGKMVWIPWQHRELANSTNPLTRNTFIIWDGLGRTHHWDHNSPLLLILGRNYFKPG